MNVIGATGAASVARRVQVAGEPDLRDQTLRDETLREQTLRDQTLRDQTLRDQTLRDQALFNLGLELKRSGYRFTAVTPETHRRVNVRNATFVPRLEDIFGWSRGFRACELPERHVELLASAGELEQSESLLHSKVRFSTLAEQIFVHSAYPTNDPQAVFFGPDTYRFARLIRSALPLTANTPLRLLDLGAGSGAGGLHAASLLRPRSSIVLSDINPHALRFSRINARLNEIVNVEVIKSDLFTELDGKFDLIIANPPYLVDPLQRLYRHGGGALGSEVSIEIVRQGIDYLAGAGRLILYTGSAIVNGVDRLRDSLWRILERSDLRFRYEEIDPDVFGEELEHRPYEEADRIAAIGLVVDRLY
jgi:methylase of polypeptide subunit release factors